MRRTFRVSDIRQDLSIDLVEKDLAPSRDPASARSELRKRVAHDVERQRLTGQMRVRAEVIREMMLEVCELSIDCDEHVREPAGSGQQAAGSTFFFPACCPLPAAS